MKKMKRLVAIFMSAIILFCSIGTNGYAAELGKVEETHGDNSQIKVYDSEGNLLETFETKEQLNDYLGISEKRAGSVGKMILRVIYDILIGVGVEYMDQAIRSFADYMTYNYFTFPPMEDGDIVTVYSLDGNVYNPYPPNSYQGANWPKNNFRIVVE